MPAATMSADEAEPETDVALTDPEAVVSMALHLVLWAVVLVAAVARTRLWFSDQALLREMFFGGATADGHLTERPYIRLLMRPFDFLLFCGVTILCWAPVYLAGEPSLAMRHLRTLLLPIGLTALAGGQIAKTVVSLKLVENEWKVRTKEMSRASAVNSSKSVARALMICVTVVTALSLAVVA